jgi:hypothetical protein
MSERLRQAGRLAGLYIDHIPARVDIDPDALQICMPHRSSDSLDGTRLPLLTLAFRFSFSLSHVMCQCSINRLVFTLHCFSLLCNLSISFLLTLILRTRASLATCDLPCTPYPIQLA